MDNLLSLLLGRAQMPKAPTMDPSAELGQQYDRRPYVIPPDVASSIQAGEHTKSGEPMGYAALFNDPHFRSQHRLMPIADTGRFDQPFYPAMDASQMLRILSADKRPLYP